MFYTHYKAKPDLYGPLWIYTTLIVILAIAGNFSRGLHQGKDFTYNFTFVPIAAAVVYGIGIGLPFALKLLMRMLGTGFFSGSFIEVRPYASLHNVLIYFLSIGHGHLRVFLLIILNNGLSVRNSSEWPIMGLNRLLSNNIDRLLDGYLLERTEGKPRRQEENPCHRLHLRCLDCVAPNIQALLLQACMMR